MWGKKDRQMISLNSIKCKLNCKWDCCLSIWKTSLYLFPKVLQTGETGIKHP